MPSRKRLSLKIILPVAIGLLLFAVATRSNDIIAAFGSAKGVRTMDTAQAEVLMAQKSLLLVDVRERQEYEVSHLKDAVLVEDIDLTKLDKTQPILVYCTIGYRSTEWGATLTDQGFRNIYNLNGGIIRWKNEGHRVYNQNQQVTDSVHVYSNLFGLLLRDGLAVE